MTIKRPVELVEAELMGAAEELSECIEEGRELQRQRAEGIVHSTRQLILRNEATDEEQQDTEDWLGNWQLQQMKEHELMAKMKRLDIELNMKRNKKRSKKNDATA